MIREAVEKIVGGQNLTFEEAKTVMNEIMSGKTSETMISAYLVALRMKGETIDEISGSAQGMRDNAVRLEHDMDVLEIVGTGGDRSNTFNISTTSAFVVAAAGCKVAKHGSRGVSSKSGAADMLEALGADITISPERSREILDKVGFCFLFAQKYHSAMRFVGPVRGELGMRTVFNILGPLTNPAYAKKDIIGVYDESLVKPIAQVLVKLGVKRGMVVYGQDTMDEITPSAKTTACEIKDGETRMLEINPEDFGIAICQKSELEGGDGAENARIAKDILSGKLQGAKRDAVLLNAGACIYIDKEDISYAKAIDMAREMIDSGKALKKMEEYVKATREKE